MNFGRLNGLTVSKVSSYFENRSVSERRLLHDVSGLVRNIRDRSEEVERVLNAEDSNYSIQPIGNFNDSLAEPSTDTYHVASDNPIKPAPITPQVYSSSIRFNAASF
jgi:hypothetical protein